MKLTFYSVIGHNIILKLPCNIVPMTCESVILADQGTPLHLHINTHRGAPKMHNSDSGPLAVPSQRMTVLIKMEERTKLAGSFYACT